MRLDQAISLDIDWSRIGPHIQNSPHQVQAKRSFDMSHGSQTAGAQNFKEDTPPDDQSGKKQGPKYLLNIEGNEVPWDQDTITASLGRQAMFAVNGPPPRERFVAIFEFDGKAHLVD